MISFPAIRPTGRQLVPGQYPVKRFVSMSGTGTTRAYGTQPFNATIELDFANLTDNAVTEIVECYDQARGSTRALSLPEEIWSGSGGDLRFLIERDYSWRFSEPPRISPVVPGRSSVTVRLEGHRDS